MSCLLFLHAGLLKHVLPVLTGTALVLIAFGFVTTTVYYIVKDAIQEDAPEAPPNDAPAAGDGAPVGGDATPDVDQTDDAPPNGRGSLSVNARRSTVSPEVEMTAAFPARRSSVSGPENPLHAPETARNRVPLRTVANAVVAANRVSRGARTTTEV